MSNKKEGILPDKDDSNTELWLVSFKEINSNEVGKIHLLNINDTVT